MVVLGVWFLEPVQRRVRVVFGESGVLKRRATSDIDERSSDSIMLIFCYMATDRKNNTFFLFYVYVYAIPE